MKKIILSLLLCFSLNAFAAELHELVKSGKVDQVREYLKAHPEHVNYEDDIKRTPLVYAVIDGNVDLVQLLIGLGADVNHEYNLKQTPLFEAARRGYFKIAQLLIGHGAKIDYEDNIQLTPLVYAAMRGHFEIAQLLIDRGADVNHESLGKCIPLYWVALSGNIDSVRFLLDRGANKPLNINSSALIKKTCNQEKGSKSGTA